MSDKSKRYVYLVMEALPQGSQLVEAFSSENKADKFIEDDKKKSFSPNNLYVFKIEIK